MKRMIMLVGITLLLVMGSAKAENKPGLDRIPVTGCVYGDSIPMDMCDKMRQEDEQPDTIPQSASPVVVPSPENDINWGK